jgi:hypothetical protein
VGGGGGGDRYVGPTSETILRKVDELHEKEKARLDGEVNELLQHLLARFNDRDTEKVAERISHIQDELGEVAELDRFLFGGSVAKHTAVNGLSDVDALVILSKKHDKSDSPQFLIEAFRRLLWQKLPRSEVASVEKGRLAVTVKYHDGQEIQLLPALQSGNTLSIASSDGKGWKDTEPRQFQRALTRANTQTNQVLVPTIKLVKSIVADLPKQKQLSGYHIEALAVDAARHYSGPTGPRTFLLHVLDHSAKRVLRPIPDVTKQTRTVDAYLGEANSVTRRSISQTLEGVKRRLETATSVGEWRDVLGLADK